MSQMLYTHRDDLAVVAQEDELTAQVKRTTDFLKAKSARVTIDGVKPAANGLAMNVTVANLGGHKLPTAYPARRAWLHVVVKDGDGRVVSESGALRPDGSIVGNDNDDDPTKYEPYYHEITKPDQVEIYEAIMADVQGKVTTGLLAGVRFIKDDRLLPSGFDKATADNDIHVVGGAAEDAAFTDKGSTMRYVVPTGGRSGPFGVEAELWYQPIAFRWAHNLAPYQASEPQRMVKYFEEASPTSGVMLAKAEATR